MVRKLSSLLAVVLLGLTSSIANADSFGLTLRYWLTEDRVPGTNEVTETTAFKASDTRLEVPAITMRWSPDGWADHDILLSYFTLDSTRDIDFLFTGGGFVTGKNQLERWDIELLVRSRVREGFFYYYGLRYVEPKSVFDLPLGNGLNLRNISQNKWYIAEFGLGITRAVSENGRHTVFANAIGGIGRFEQNTVNYSQREGLPDTIGSEFSETETGHSIDLNFGYQYTINPSSSVSLRYRDWASYRAGDLEITSAGIDLGLTFNF